MAVEHVIHMSFPGEEDPHLIEMGQEHLYNEEEILILSIIKP